MVDAERLVRGVDRSGRAIGRRYRAAGGEQPAGRSAATSASPPPARAISASCARSAMPASRSARSTSSSTAPSSTPRREARATSSIGLGIALLLVVLALSYAIGQSVARPVERLRARARRRRRRAIAISASRTTARDEFGELFDAFNGLAEFARARAASGPARGDRSRSKRPASAPSPCSSPQRIAADRLMYLLRLFHQSDPVQPVGGPHAARGDHADRPRSRRRLGDRRSRMRDLAPPSRARLRDGGAGAAAARRERRVPRRQRRAASRRRGRLRSRSATPSPSANIGWWSNSAPFATRSGASFDRTMVFAAPFGERREIPSDWADARRAARRSATRARCSKPFARAPSSTSPPFPARSRPRSCAAPAPSTARWCSASAT